MRTSVKKAKWKKRLAKEVRRNWILYLMILPVLAYYIIFNYIPMYGALIAFKDYHIKDGILGSPWVGLDHFKRFFALYNVKNLFRNTLVLSLYGYIGFPIPIIFALLLNYSTTPRLKKVVQMVSYAPNFISIVVICGMITLFFGQDFGLYNILRSLLGLETRNLLAEADAFKHLYTWSGIWQSTGFSAIIYISALAGVDPEMHEAAIIDGATKIQRMIHIDIPSISSMIIMILILSFGNIMGVGFQKVYLLSNELNSPASTIISTYTYEVGLINHQYDYAAAVGLFNSIVNIILLVTANFISKKVLNESVL